MKKFITMLLSAIMVCSMFIVPVSAYSTEGVEGFVARCYQIALGREPDDEGIKGWSEQLRSGEACGVSVAFGFVYSPEFQTAGFDNATYVEKMYNMLLGRASDEEGKAYWVDALNNGADREEIFSGFANSQEFYNLCDSYGIFAGYYINAVGMERNASINGFVNRLYTICLGRHGDMAGQAGWVSQLASGATDGCTAAHGFIFSDEYMSKNATIDEYVTMLYNTFLGREPDKSGLESWVDSYFNGRSISKIFDGFAKSDEFKNLCDKYGINPGHSNYGRIVQLPLPSEVGPALKLFRDNYVSIYDGTVIDETEQCVEFFNAGFHDSALELVWWDYDGCKAYPWIYVNTVSTLAYSVKVESNVSEPIYFEYYYVDNNYQLKYANTISPKHYRNGTFYDIDYTDSSFPNGTYLLIATDAAKENVLFVANCMVIDNPQ